MFDLGDVTSWMLWLRTAFCAGYGDRCVPHCYPLGKCFGEGCGETDLRGDVLKRVDGLLVIRLFWEEPRLSWVNMDSGGDWYWAQKKALRGEPF